MKLETERIVKIHVNLHDYLVNPMPDFLTIIF